MTGITHITKEKLPYTTLTKKDSEKHSRERRQEHRMQVPMLDCRCFFTKNLSPNGDIILSKMNLVISLVFTYSTLNSEQMI